MKQVFQACCAASLALVALDAGGLAFAQETPAALLGRAVLSSDTTFAPPADAPALFRRSGRFTGPDGARQERLGATPDPRGDIGLPIEGQPVQGVSAVVSAGDGSYWALADNGFGARVNSADALLVIHRLRPRWNTEELHLVRSLVLSDPNRVAPFPIVSEASDTRYLTGADFDPESIQQRSGGGFWIGEEFGPSLLEVDHRGHLLAVYPATGDGGTLRSPDHWALTTPAGPGESLPVQVRRSRGFEGMTSSLDGRYLYLMLEGPVADPATGALETADQRPVARIVEFDTDVRAFSGRVWLYPLENAGHAIGDIAMIGPDAALVIERDNAQGAEATIKRVYRIDFGPAGGVVRKGPFVDLLAIHSRPGRPTRFTFPFVTIESLAWVGGDLLLILNDNNFPFSAGRDPARGDDTEAIVISAPGLFATR